MEFDYTDYEYLTECTDGCSSLTRWLQSKQVANGAGRNHEKETGHRWQVQERMKEYQKKRTDTGG